MHPKHLTQLTIDDYYHWILENHKELNLHAYKPLLKTIWDCMFNDISFDQFYIPLQLFRKEEESLAERQEQRYLETFPQKLLEFVPYHYSHDLYLTPPNYLLMDPMDLIEKPKKAVIQGPSGSGKTTLLSYIAKTIATGTQDIFPVYLSLQKFAICLNQDPTLSLEDFGIQEVSAYDMGFQLVMKEYVANEKVLWLLDDIDQINISFYSVILHQIQSLKGKVIITSRAFSGFTEKLTDFHQYVIHPLTYQQTDGFLKKWFMTVAGFQGCEENWALSQVELAHEKISDLSFIPDFIQFPFGLISFAVLYPRLDAEQNDKFSILDQLIREIFHTYNSSHQNENLKQLFKAYSLSDSEGVSLILEVFSFLGWQHFKGTNDGKTYLLQGSSSFWKEVENFIKEQTGIKAEVANLAQKVIAFLADTKFIQFYQPNSLQGVNFQPTLFLDYAVSRILAKSFAKRRFDTWHLLRSRLHWKEWKEPIELLAAQMQQKDLSWIVQRLLNGVSQSESRLKRDLWLAAKLIGRHPSLDERIKHKAIDKINRVLARKGDRSAIREAHVALGNIYRHKSKSFLLNLKTHKDRVIRLFAVKSLSTLYPSSLLTKELLNSLSDGAEEIRALIVEYFGAARDVHAIDTLIQIVNNAEESIEIRKRAAHSLGVLASPEAISALAGLLDKKHNEVSFMQAIIYSLGETKNASVIPLLVNMLHAPIYSRNALQALSNFRDVVPLSVFVDALSDSDPSVTHIASKTLGKIDTPEAIYQLVHLLSNEAEDINRRSYAAESLSKTMNQEAIDILISTMRDQNEKIRWACINSLGVKDQPGIKGALICALSDSSPYVRSSAIRFLENKLNAEEIDLLIPLLDDEDPIVFQAAAEVIGKLGGEKSVMVLLEKNTISDPHQRSSIILALGYTKDPRILPILHQAYYDYNDDVRLSVIEALGAINHPECFELILTALDDHNEIIRDEAVLVFEKLIPLLCSKNHANRMSSVLKRKNLPMSTGIKIANQIDYLRKLG